MLLKHSNYMHQSKAWDMHKYSCLVLGCTFNNHYRLVTCKIKLWNLRAFQAFQETQRRSTGTSILLMTSILIHRFHGYWTLHSLNAQAEATLEETQSCHASHLVANVLHSHHRRGHLTRYHPPGFHVRRPHIAGDGRLGLELAPILSQADVAIYRIYPLVN